MLTRPRTLSLAALALALLPLWAVLPTATATAANTIPAQWMAKIYSEGLGRAPDQGAWSSLTSFFSANACGAATLAQEGEQIYLSSEFAGLGYDNPSRLLALYRGALDREPDASGFSFYLGKLNSGTAWAQVVDTFFTSSEFTGDAPSFCTQGSYTFGPGAAITIPLGQGCSGQFCFTGGTQAQLQAMLDAAAPSHATVTLAQHVVVPVTTAMQIGPPRTRMAGLDIPAGVTLTTAGQPGPSVYAEMGRLVRAGSLGPAAVVEVESGAKLANVWVDGQRTSPSDHVPDSVNVETAGGSGTTVSSDRISNAVGFTNLHALGTAESLPCAGNTITGNLVTAYSSSHLSQLWSDGLSIACENATVTGNTIIDATDVGIVLFRAYPAGQRSTISGNTILNAGNPAFGGIVADPLTSTPAVGPSFAGSSITRNTLWTGPGSFFGIALSAGSAAWFTSPNIGTGVSFTLNTSGSLTANVTEGIAVSGMMNATVQQNTVTANLGQHGSCPQAQVAVDPNLGSGNIQGPITSVQVRHCI